MTRPFRWFKHFRSCDLDCDGALPEFSSFYKILYVKFIWIIVFMDKKALKIQFWEHCFLQLAYEICGSRQGISLTPTSPPPPFPPPPIPFHPSSLSLLPTPALCLSPLSPCLPLRYRCLIRYGKHRNLAVTVHRIDRLRLSSASKRPPIFNKV